MNKNLLKIFLVTNIIVVLILALIIAFCNTLGTPLINHTNLAVQMAEPNVAQPLGDRGSTHLPDFGFSLPSQPWFMVLICVLAFASLVSIIALSVIKAKANKAKEAQKKKMMQEQKEQTNVKSSASLKEIVAKNLENDAKEYEKIDNPKH